MECQNKRFNDLELTRLHRRKDGNEHRKNPR